jgi:hypothetical protein
MSSRPAWVIARSCLRKEKKMQYINFSLVLVAEFSQSVEIFTGGFSCYSDWFIHLIDFVILSHFIPEIALAWS